MNKNANLHKAKKAKNDEFYTRYEDIDKEIQHYRDKLKGLIVYCPCDDYRWSNFVKYFKDNFEYYGLKGLVATNYDIGDGAWKYEYDGKTEHVERLQGNGDFRSEECIEFLKEADVVVTNPPFSLFREYVKQLMDYGKKFLIIGPHSAVTYKEIFPYIKNGELWFGRMVTHKEDGKSTIKGNSMSFERYVGGTKDVGAWWFTNIEEVRKNDFFVPKHRKSYKMYSNEYPKYDNYDAIEVSSWDDIPLDYNGIMGVPYTGLKHFCPKQFEIIWLDGINTDEWRGRGPSLNGKNIYRRLFIRNRNA